MKRKLYASQPAMRSKRSHAAPLAVVGPARLADPMSLSAGALDDLIAIVGTAGSGKTYAAKGFVERLLDSGARVAIVDPLGVWWGLRASAAGSAPGYPVVVFGGKHADVSITAEMGGALGRLIAGEALAALSTFPSSAAAQRVGASWQPLRKPCTRLMRSRCTSYSTRRISGRRNGRSKVERVFSATSRKSCAVAVCAASFRGLSRNGRPSCTLAAQGKRHVGVDELAAALGKKPVGGHWNSGIAVLRNNGLIESEPVSGQPANGAIGLRHCFANKAPSEYQPETLL